MQHALPSTSTDSDVVPGRSSSAPRLNKILAAGVAAVGAGAMVVNPAAPMIQADAIEAHVKTASVELTAAADPIALLQTVLAETLTNLELLGINGGNSAEALAAAFQNADLAGEISTIISANLANPLPLITRLLTLQAVYGDDLEVALFGWDDNPLTGPTANNPTGIDPYEGVFDRIQGSFEDLGPTLADILTYDPPANDPNQSPLTNAVFEANFYFVFGLLDPLRPLITATPTGIVPLFSMPGDFLGGETVGGFEGGLPGFVAGVDDPTTSVNEALSTGTRIDNLINVLNEQTFVRALTGPFQTVAFQVAQSLDDAQAAYDAGNTDLATNELVNLPTRALNAFVNGFKPSFSTCNGVGCNAEWPSLIDATQQQPGLLKYVLVDLPNQITAALGGTAPVYQPTLPAQTSTLQKVSSPDVSPLAATYTLDPTESIKETEEETLAVDTDAADEEELLLDAEADADADDEKPRPYKPGRILSSIADRVTNRLFGADKDEESEEAADAAADDDDDDTASEDDDADAGTDSEGAESESGDE